jgi:hypothetical protein
MRVVAIVDAANNREQGREEGRTMEELVSIRRTEKEESQDVCGEKGNGKEG